MEAFYVSEVLSETCFATITFDADDAEMRKYKVTHGNDPHFARYASLEDALNAVLEELVYAMSQGWIISFNIERLH